MAIGINTNISINTNIETTANTNTNETQPSTTLDTPETSGVSYDNPAYSPSIQAMESAFNANYLAYQLNTQSFSPNESQVGVYNGQVTVTDDLGLSATQSFLTLDSSNGGIDDSGVLRHSVAPDIIANIQAPLIE